MNITKAFILMSLFGGMLCYSSPPSAALPGSTVLVSNISAPVHEVSRKHLRRIFSMRARQWDDGREIRVFVLVDDHKVHEQFCLSVLELLPHQLRRAWDRLTYSGMGSSPEMVTSEVDMLEHIAKTPGSIGYVTDSVNPGSIEGVQIVRVQ